MEINYIGSNKEKSESQIKEENTKNDLLQKLMEATPQEVGTWIDNNVTDLKSAKNVLKHMGMLVCYLAQKTKG